MPDSISNLTSSLLGHWEKITTTDCARIYPEFLDFKERGQYTGRMSVLEMFTLWDVGTYELTHPDRLRISTANDAIIDYAVEIATDTLQFEDAGGCSFHYRRIL